MEAIGAGGEEARRAFEAMMSMEKIDVAAIEAEAARALNARGPAAQLGPPGTEVLSPS